MPPMSHNFSSDVSCQISAGTLVSLLLWSIKCSSDRELPDLRRHARQLIAG